MIYSYLVGSKVQELGHRRREIEGEAGYKEKEEMYTRQEARSLGKEVRYKGTK